MGAELNRKKHGEKTETGMGMKQLEDFASKRGMGSDKKHQHDTGRHKKPRGA